MTNILSAIKSVWDGLILHGYWLVGGGGKIAGTYVGQTKANCSRPTADVQEDRIALGFALCFKKCAAASFDLLVELLGGKSIYYNKEIRILLMDACSSWVRMAVLVTRAINHPSRVRTHAASHQPIRTPEYSSRLRAHIRTEHAHREQGCIVREHI